MAFELRNNGWISVPWAQYISKAGTVDDAVLDWHGNHVTFSILVNDTDWFQAVQDILGNQQFVYNGGVLTLSRKPPIGHPFIGGVFAERITGCKGIGWRGKGQFLGAGAGGSGAPFSLYQYRLITIEFRMPRYVVMDDATLFHTYGSPQQEWQRYIEERQEPSSEIISRPSTSMVFVEGAVAGKQPIADVGYPISKPTFYWIWKRVPKIGLFGGGGFGAPTNLLKGVGCVNQFPFGFGSQTYEAGTLLLQPPRFVPLELPYPWASALNQPEPPPLLYDVEIPILYFPQQSATGAYYGHNLSIYNDGKWYLMMDANTSTKTMLAPCDFSTLWYGNP
jgi:hypothetical protein